MAAAALRAAAGLRRASDLHPDVAGTGEDRQLPVRADLQCLFPAGGLRRGTAVTINTGRSPGGHRYCLR